VSNMILFYLLSLYVKSISDQKGVDLKNNTVNEINFSPIFILSYLYYNNYLDFIIIIIIIINSTHFLNMNNIILVILLS